jgi:hypothetical protein
MVRRVFHRLEIQGSVLRFVGNKMIEGKKMRIFLANIIVGLSSLFYFPSHAHGLEDKACRVIVTPKNKSTADRQYIFNFVKDKSIVVCPFSSGGAITFIQAPCSPDAMKRIGDYKVENIDQDKFYQEASKCSPLMWIKTPEYKYQDPVISYLLFNKDEQFSPGQVRDSDDAFDHQLRQFLNDIGAPLVYYNGISNLICMSARVDEKFSLDEMIKKFGLKIPTAISIEKSNSSCPSWVKERFHVSLSEPISRR